jgi:membrane protein implicated in regulation of membrane protease activity
MDFSWWLWLLAGIVLFLIELATPGGFYFLFFGIGAFVVGLLGWAGVDGSLVVQLFLFGGLSTVSLAIFRKPLQRRLGKLPGKDVDTMIGETAVALSEIGLEQVGKAELRGSAWSARNVGENVILTGQRCKVERIEGLMLFIRG